MRKIVVAHHCNQLGLGGTEKDMQILCKYLNKDLFEVHALAKQHPVPRARALLDRVRAAFGDENARSRRAQSAFAHARLPDFEDVLGKGRVHLYTPAGLPRLMAAIAPHILHVHYAGGAEPPLDRADIVNGIPLLFAVNVFGYRDGSEGARRLSKILFVSNWLKDEGAPWCKGDPRCDVLYCPVEKPFSDGDLRAELGIGRGVFVVGRIGRNADDIHDPISLRAYRKIESARTLFLALSAPPQMKKDARDLGIRRILYLKPTVDDGFISRFYNTIDVLAHARLDGETFGCVIAEAMIHGKPVVTHLSHVRNAQAELVGVECGFVLPRGDWGSYAEKLKLFLNDAGLRGRMGAAARRRAWENFEAGVVARRLENFYFEELRKKGIPLPA